MACDASSSIAVMTWAYALGHGKAIREGLWRVAAGAAVTPAAEMTERDLQRP